MFASIQSCFINGVSGSPIRVEVHSSSGMPGYTVVGMPDASMRESKERVRAALISSGLKWPQSRMTINLAPASVRKSGTGAELATLIGILCVSGILDSERFADAGVIGELGLDGSIRSINGTIARVLALRNSGVEEVFVPLENAYEASLVNGIHITPIASVSQLVNSLTQAEPWPDIPIPSRAENHITYPDFREVSGQPLGCFAMMLLAAGGHHTLLMGSPGIGKTMLAERLPGILPDTSREDSIEIAAIKSVTSGSITELTTSQPYCSPHHGASSVSMVGGGSTIASPGEVTRAHKGILFLDELGEFSTNTIDALRQPLEKKEVTISRAHFTTTLPADFTLLACSNPCPCAKPREKCMCSDAQRAKYLRRLSGPLLDRFDIRLELFRNKFVDGSTHDTSTMKEKVLAARARQSQRNIMFGKVSNAHLTSAELEEISPLGAPQFLLYRELIEKREISGRGARCIWRLARTIADINDEDNISETALLSAFDMREEIQ